MVVTREDKFGCIGDACGTSDSLRFESIPRNCINAVREGARDARRDGLGAWARHDRCLYAGLLVAAIVAAVALVRRLAQRQRPPPGMAAPFPHAYLAPPVLERRPPPPVVADYVLVPRSSLV